MTDGVNAAATLSLDINTSEANAKLTALEGRLKEFEGKLSGVGKDSQAVAQLKTQIASLTAEVEALNNATGKGASCFKKKLTEIESLQAAEIAIRKDGTKQALRVIADGQEAEAVSYVRWWTESLNDQEAAQNKKLKAQSTWANATLAAQESLAGKSLALQTLWSNSILKAQESQEAKSKALQSTWANAALAAQESLAGKSLAAQEAQQAKSLALEKAYILMSEKQRLQAAVNASKLMSAGHTDLSGQFAPSTLSMAGAGKEHELTKQLTALTPVTREAAGAQKLWNEAGSEAHAVVRGLSGSLGQLWLTYGQIAPLLAGAALGAGFKHAMEKGAEFEYQLTFVKALGGESAQAVRELSETALKLGTTGMKGPTELASGLRILAQAGLSAKEAIVALPSAMNLAVVGEMSMEDAAVTLVGVMSAFKLQISDMTHIGDVFAKAAAMSQSSVVDMTHAMKTASVVGSEYGVKMEDAATALTLLAKVNISGTAAGTALRNMLKEIYTPTKQSAEVMKQLGLSASDSSGKLKPMADVIFELKGKLEGFDRVSQTNILQKLFGERGAKEAVEMLQLTKEEWISLRNEITQSEGFMSKVSAELNQTTKGVFAQAKNILEADLISAFDRTDGAAHKLAESLRDLFDSPAVKEGLVALVSGMTSLAEVLVKFAPALLAVGSAWAVFSLVPMANAALVGLFATMSEGLVTVGAVWSAFQAGSAMFGAMEVSVGLLGTAFSALATPLGLVVTLITAYSSISKVIADATPQSVKDTDNLTSALDRQTTKLKEENAELEKKIRLLGGASQAASSAGYSKQLASLYDELEIAKKAQKDINPFTQFQGINAEREINERIKQLKESRAATQQESLKNDELTFKAYAGEQLKTLEGLRDRAVLLKRKVNTETLQGLISQLDAVNRPTGEALALLKEQIAAEEQSLKQELSIKSGSQKFAGAEKTKSQRSAEVTTELAAMKQIADVDKAALETQIAYLEAQKAGGKISERELDTKKAQLKVQESLGYAAAAYAQMVKISQTEASKFGGKTPEESAARQMAAFNKADTEYKTAIQNATTASLEGDKKIGESHDKLMKQLAKDNAKFLGQEANYAEQAAEEWENSYGKTYKDFSEFLDSTNSLTEERFQQLMDAMEAMRENKKKRIEIGTLKDSAKSAETTLAELKNQFSALDQTHSGGIFGGLLRDAEKTDLLKSKIESLKTTLEALDKNDTPAMRAEAAKLRKEIQALYSDSQKGLDTLLKDIEGGLTSALQAGFANGGFSSKSFIDNLKAQLKAAALKITISATVDPVMGTIKGALSNALGVSDVAGPNGAGSLLSLASSANTMLGGSAAVSGFASGVSEAALGAQFVGPSATLAGGTLGTAASAGSMLGSVAAAAPYVAAALVIADALGAFGKGGGPQQGQYGDLASGGKYNTQFTMSGGDTLGNQKLTESAMAQIEALAKAADRKITDLSVDQGYKLDPQGSAQGLAYRRISIGGRKISGGDFNGNTGADFYTGHDDAAGVARYLGTLHTGEFLALLKELNDPKLNAAADALMKNFGELEKSLPAYLVAEDMRKQMDRSLMSSEDKVKDTGESLKKMFESLGKTVPESSDAFKSLIDGLDLTTSEGQKALATFNSMGPAFLEWISATDAARAALKQQMEDIDYQLKTMGMTAFDKTIFDINKATDKAVESATKLSASEADLAKIREVGTKQVEAATKAAKEAADAAQAQAYGTGLGSYANLIASSGDQRGSLEFQAKTASDSLHDKLTELAKQLGVTTEAAQGYIDAHGGMKQAVADFWNESASKIEDADTKLKVTGLLDGLINAADGVNKSSEAVKNFDKEAADKANALLESRYGMQLELAKLNKDEAAISAALAGQRTIALAKLDSSLQGLQTQLWALQDAADRAARKLQTYNDYISAGQALASAMQAIKDKADSSQLAVDSAKTAITDGYIAAQQKVNDLLKQSAEEMRGFAKNIKDFVTSLSLTTGTSAQNYAAMQADFAINAAAASAGDKTALGSITNKAQTLLDAGKNQVATATDYALLVGSVKATLTNISTLADGRAGPLGEAVDPLIAAQQDLAKWQHAIAVSGASTERTLTDYADDWRKANEVNLKAQADLVAATQMLVNSGITQQAIDNTLITTLQALSKAIETFGTARTAAVASGGVSAAVASGAMTVAAPTVAPSIGQTIVPVPVTPTTVATGAATPEVYWDAALQAVLVRNPSFAVGTDSVPYDMTANIHKDERIMPAADNRELMRRLNQPSASADMVLELKALRESNELLRAEVRAIVRYTGDTSRNLQRVIPDGDALTTRVVV